MLYERLAYAPRSTTKRTGGPAGVLMYQFFGILQQVRQRQKPTNQWWSVLFGCKGPRCILKKLIKFFSQSQRLVNRHAFGPGGVQEPQVSGTAVPMLLLLSMFIPSLQYYHIVEGSSFRSQSVGF